MKKRPKVLYAIQGTGNGHVARAREIIPILLKYCDLDIALSGDQSQVELPVTPKYRSKGLTFIYNSKGGISYFKTLIKNNLLGIVREIWQFPIQQYDIVINDFEFITSWACKLRKQECIGLGHQVSFLSKNTPRPAKFDRIGESILKNYAPCSKPIGFHFDQFDDFVFKPVIRKEIRQANITNQGHITVYLPAYGEEEIQNFLCEFPKTKWQVFSKHSKYKREVGSITFIPTGNEEFVKSFISCDGIFSSAGFESPAEALFMGKKLLVVPIKNQYEQYCNAAALHVLGVPVIDALGKKQIGVVDEWLKSTATVVVNYPDETEKIVAEQIFKDFGLSKKFSYTEV